MLLEPSCAVIVEVIMSCRTDHMFCLTCITEVMDDLYSLTDKKTGAKMPMLAEEYYSIIKENADKLNSAIIYDRDFSYNYFGFKVCTEHCLTATHELNKCLNLT